MSLNEKRLDFSAQSLICEDNKPDFRELNLGSPVSPLRNVNAITTTSSSSSSSDSITVNGRNSTTKKVENQKNAVGLRNQSPKDQNSKAPLNYSSMNAVNSSNPSGFPRGNICPSGKICKTGMLTKGSSKGEILRSGSGKYGYGSMIKVTKSSNFESGNIQIAGESVMVRKALASSDPEELKKAGNELYNRGNFIEALCLYDKAISISPDNVVCRCNKAAALMNLGRLMEALRECEEVVRIDPCYVRAHQRLVTLHLRLGRIQNAKRHLSFAGYQMDNNELEKLKEFEKHLNRCTEARKAQNWKIALQEVDAAIASGADSSPQLFALRAEALLRLCHLDAAESALSNLPKFENSPSSCSQTMVFGMLSDSYLLFVRSQVEMARGRFENAIAAIEKAGMIDFRNSEVAMMINTIKSVAKARTEGNELFNCGKFEEACLAYGEGLKFDPFNPVLYCNRAACRSKLGQWELSIKDCNHALSIQPKYTKALLRRAASNCKLEHWAESVRDYEILRLELPNDNEVAEALFHAQVALKKSRGEEISNMKFGGEVEEISGLNQFKEAISSSGVAVVHFKSSTNPQCNQMVQFLDLLSFKYPSVNFLKVDVDENPIIAQSENVSIVPTFKIYKNGTRVKEMIHPSQQILEYSVKHYGL